ncbi:MAG: hypothetical protein AB1Z98_03355 [Nannocystaceae bacterium]
MTIALGAALLAAPAEASELRFSQTAAGQVVATGNTLGLSKEFAANGPGIEDSIGTFISLDGASMDLDPANPGNPWGPNTTNDWTANGSEASLQIPEGVEVLYAELVWGGSTIDSAEDVTANLDDPVTLVANGDSELVSPSAATALDVSEVASSGFFANYYMRSAEVTEFVRIHGPSVYAVQGVPATQSTATNSLNAAGWTLIVAYRDSSERIRNLTIFVGGSFVDEDSIEDYDFAGFCTPPSGAFTGRAVVTSMEGDADLTGDGFGIGPSAAGPFVPLSGPNNPVDNFFCSQLDDPAGELDPAGSFGAVNHDPFTGINVVGGRQGWDVAQLAVSSAAGQFSNGQTSAVLRADTTGDSFAVVATAFSIQVNAPDFSSDGNGAQAAPTLIATGDSSTITVNMRNDGLVDATGLVFTAPLPDGLILDSFTLDGAAGDVNGAAVDATRLTTGVPIGDVPVGVSRQIEVVVEASGPPDDGATFVVQPQWDYDYISCEGEPPLSEPHSTEPIEIDYEPTGVTSGAVDDTAGDEASGGASAEGTGTGVDTDGGTDSASTSGFVTGSASAGTVTEEDGCGCRSRGRTPSWAWALLLPVLLRRRRAGR